MTDAPAALGLKGLASKAVGAIKTVTGPGHAALSALQDFASKGQTPEMRRQIVDYMLTTDGDKQLRALQSSMKALPSPKGKPQLLLPPPAQKMLGAFLAAAAAHGAGSSSEPEEHQPYRDGGHVARAHAALRALPR